MIQSAGHKRPQSATPIPAPPTPPGGHGRWTLDLLGDRRVALKYVPRISRDTVGRTRKNNEIKPWLKEEWRLPPECRAEFVWKIEDVLDVYQRPYDPQRPALRAFLFRVVA